MAKRYDMLLRLLLVGDTGVGKTCLICRYAQDEFNENHITTIGNVYFVRIYVDYCWVIAVVHKMKI